MRTIGKVSMKIVAFYDGSEFMIMYIGTKKKEWAVFRYGRHQKAGSPPVITGRSEREIMDELRVMEAAQWTAKKINEFKNPRYWESVTWKEVATRFNLRENSSFVREKFQTQLFKLIGEVPGGLLP